MRKVLVVLLVLSVLPAANAFARGVGTSAANFLKIGQGARPAGMGSAFVAVSDDINSLEWNPAGLASLAPDYFDAAFQHTFWFGDVEYEMLSYAQSLGEANGGGLQLLYRHLPDVDNDISDESPLKVYDMAGVLGYGFQQSNFSIGLNVKFISTQLGTEQLSGEAADLGMMIHFLDNKMCVAAAVQNLGPDIRGDSLPLMIRGGVAYMDTYGDQKQNALNASFEVDQPLDNSLTLLVGGEYWYMQTFALRVGFRQQAGADDMQTDNIMNHFTAGAGIRWADLQLDYAFASYADLGITHRLMLRLHYGPISDAVDKL